MTIVEIDLEKIHSLRCISVFLYFCSLSLFLMQPATENLLSRNQPREINGHTKFLREKHLDPRKPRGKTFGLTKN